MVVDNNGNFESRPDPIFPKTPMDTTTRSELIDRLYNRHHNLRLKDIDAAVKTMLEHMTETLITGERIEIRGFGSFSLRLRPARMGRNPMSGEPVSLPERYSPHFKPGKELREMVDVKAGE